MGEDVGLTECVDGDMALRKDGALERVDLHILVEEAGVIVGKGAVTGTEACGRAEAAARAGVGTEADVGAEAELVFGLVIL